MGGGGGEGTSWAAPSSRLVSEPWEQRPLGPRLPQLVLSLGLPTVPTPSSTGPQVPCVAWKLLCPPG